jgi:hypothetical protein
MEAALYRQNSRPGRVKSRLFASTAIPVGLAGAVLCSTIAQAGEGAEARAGDERLAFADALNGVDDQAYIRTAQLEWLFGGERRPPPRERVRTRPSPETGPAGEGPRYITIMRRDVFGNITYHRVPAPEHRRTSKFDSKNDRIRHAVAEKLRLAPPPPPTNGPLLITVSLAKQQLTLYDRGIPIAQSPVSTGTRSHPTPTGVFSILQKQYFHRSNMYSSAPMPYMQRITWAGVALHAGELPGYAASHGCIRLPEDFAIRLWGTTQPGVRVIVTQNEVRPVAISHPLLFTPKQPEPELAPEPVPLPPLRELPPPNPAAPESAPQAGHDATVHQAAIENVAPESVPAAPAIPVAAAPAAPEPLLPVRELPLSTLAEPASAPRAGDDATHQAAVEEAAPEPVVAAPVMPVAAAPAAPAPQATPAPVRQPEPAVEPVKKAEAGSVPAPVSLLDEIAHAVPAVAEITIVRGGRTSAPATSAAGVDRNVMEGERGVRAERITILRGGQPVEFQIVDMPPVARDVIGVAPAIAPAAEEPAPGTQAAIADDEDDELVAEAPQVALPELGTMPPVLLAYAGSDFMKFAKLERRAVSEPQAQPAAETPPTPFVSLLRPGPVSVYISRRTQRIYVRKGFEAVFDMPITVSQPQTTMGTHVFTANALTDDGTAFRWTVVSLDHASGKRASADDGKAARAALDRIALPEEAVTRISQIVGVGTTVIVTDNGPGRAQSPDNDFSVVLR